MPVSCTALGRRNINLLITAQARRPDRFQLKYWTRYPTLETPCVAWLCMTMNTSAYVHLNRKILEMCALSVPPPHAPTPTHTVTMLCAVYEYTAQFEEELSFPEGAKSELIRMNDNGVDDGWWEGRYEGKVGVFPSVVVEVLSNSVSEVCVLSVCHCVYCVLNCVCVCVCV